MPDGRTIRDVLSGDINNNREAIFLAQLNDLSSALFRRAPDGTLTTLAPLLGSGDLNDKGEIAFLASGVIFFINASGQVSKVVGPGDPAPGGGSFTGIGFPQLNNKGQIAFFASLSTGKSGIFVAPVALLETKFVDPVADLLVGSAITSAPTELAKNGRVVEGIAADGVAQVVVRVKTGQEGTVELSLADSQGGSLPASNFNGSLGLVGSRGGSSTVSVSTVDVEGIGPMAFAAYHAPTDFSSSPDSVEAGLPEREIFIKVKLTTSTGETVESTESLKIVRPSVVLVHGIWSDFTTWNQFGGLSRLNPDPRFAIFTINYSGSDAFAWNADLTQAQLGNLIEMFKDGANPTGNPVAAIQADIVAHSMGGTVARTMVTRRGFLRGENFGKGDVHKLITIDTPHLGSHFANRLIDSNLFCRLVFRLGGYPVAGAIRDLAVGSSMLQTLQNTPKVGLKTHVLVGIANSAQEQSAEENFRNLASGLASRICPNILPAGGLQEVFGGSSDLLVSDESQAAAGLGFSGGNLPGQVSPDTIHSVIPKLFTFGPDALSRDMIDGQVAGALTLNPQRVIDLLNQSVLSDFFGRIRP
ncbi:MAG: hypothetical protein HY694_11440 [Deltaproteobacteria bacterium]|nr:hypothetical protein [Deltaproteobacteria bacterium]